MNKRIVTGWSSLLAATVLALLLVSACSPKGKSAHKVFHLNISSGYLESLDPAYAKDLNMMWICHMLYNTLVTTDEQLNLAPCLARSWDVSADGLCWTFHLRTDVYFHDDPVFAQGAGRRFTAADVVFSFSRIMSPEVASPGAWIFHDRVSPASPFEAVDDSTFRIRLSKPFRPLPGILSMAYCSIVAREAVEKWGKDYRAHPCGTGPFSFRYWDEDNALELLRNPHYFERDSNLRRLPYLDAVQVSFTDSKATEFLLFLQGKVDFVNGVNTASKDLVLTKNGQLQDEYRGRFRLLTGDYLNTEYIGFLLDTSVYKSPASNILVRKAINYAIDRQKLVTYFRNGMATPALQGFIPAGMPGFDSTSAYAYRYDPEKALRLLAQAGYPHGAGMPQLTILVPNTFEDMVNFIAGELKDIGIDLKIELIQPNVLKQQMSLGKALMFRAQWLADYPDAETYLAFFYGGYPAPPNYTRFSNPVFDSLYQVSISLPDRSRLLLYRMMDSLAMDGAPVIPLYYEKRVYLLKNKITGFRSNALNIIDLSHVNTEPE